MEQMYSELRETVVSGTFSFVAVDENKKPTPILDRFRLIFNEKISLKVNTDY